MGNPLNLFRAGDWRFKDSGWDQAKYQDFVATLVPPEKLGPHHQRSKQATHPRRRREHQKKPPAQHASPRAQAPQTRTAASHPRRNAKI
ncbi:hypothetical protein JTE90_007021 [Oedothorax gibbosus]|uniref:Uncharacterized protein n=1 Tax=Oedothorax gibbosus TaxID=931172 RepID=A0AAV6TEY0_9ARAC|nr:hypothetical protein JTE90_007021 [Oedothorax gibbosus]